MKGTYIDIGGNNGDVTSFNRSAVDGETEFNFNPATDMTPGFGYSDYLLYKVVDGVLTLKDQAERDAINAEKVKAANRAAAEIRQAEALLRLEDNEKRSRYGLPPIMSQADEVAHKQFVQNLQGDIDNPSSDQAYNPPLPPGVTPPQYDSITVLVTRQTGWNDALGWKAVISSASENFAPANLAISVHTGADCTGYKYTTGAFQYDSENDEYFAICPPGQEPGDADEFMGLLYGGAQLACWTLEAGVSEKSIYAYDTGE